MASDVTQLWTRQAWDSDASFDRFHRYYLAQDAPRSLDEAYRRYHAARWGARQPGLQRGAEEVAPRRAPGQWQRWFRGQDGKGRPIAGAVGWEARGAAYDDHLAELDRQRWKDRQRAIREADFAAGEELRALAARVLKEAPLFDGKKRRIKGRDGEPDTIVETVAINAEVALRALKLASELQRLAAEVLPPAQRHEVAGKLDIEHSVDSELYQRALAALADALGASVP